MRPLRSKPRCRKLPIRSHQLVTKVVGWLVRQVGADCTASGLDERPQRGSQRIERIAIPLPALDGG